jgi:hypothetical protein
MAFIGDDRKEHLQSSCYGLGDPPFVPTLKQTASSAGGTGDRFASCLVDAVDLNNLLR